MRDISLVRLRPPRLPQRGYSLTEMLVVLAIIGMISLVAVPSFISMQRNSKVKTALRQFTSDLRAARQHAVTQYRRTKISFATGPTASGYAVYEQTGVDGSGNPVWNQLDRKELETVYFHSTTFTDQDTPANSTYDIVFRVNGSLEPLASPPAEYNVVIRTDWDLPYNQYTIKLHASGNLQATGSHF